MNNQRHSQVRGQVRRDNRNSSGKFDTNRIVLTKDKLPSNLFSQVAEDAAKYVAEWKDEKGRKKASKPTQLRKFYDEICMWDGKSQTHPDRFDEYLPFILMLKAKVAYSKGRDHVNDAYIKILNHCLAELEKLPESKTLHNLKLFMEAFTGFYKVYGPKN